MRSCQRQYAKIHQNLEAKSVWARLVLTMVTRVESLVTQGFAFCHNDLCARIPPAGLLLQRTVAPPRSLKPCSITLTLEVHMRVHHSRLHFIQCIGNDPRIICNNNHWLTRGPPHATPLATAHAFAASVPLHTKGNELVVAYAFRGALARPPCLRGGRLPPHQPNGQPRRHDMTWMCHYSLRG